MMLHPFHPLHLDCQVIQVFLDHHACHLLLLLLDHLACLESHHSQAAQAHPVDQQVLQALIALVHPTARKKKFNEKKMGHFLLSLPSA